MTFDENFYLGDDEVDEYGDSGAYGEWLEEDFEEEEEEEEEAGLPGTAVRTDFWLPSAAALCRGFVLITTSSLGRRRDSGRTTPISGRRTPQAWQQRRLPEIQPPSRWSGRSRWSWLQI